MNDSLFYQLIFDYTLRNVALGSAVLGIVSGAMGSFAVLRRQSLLGDSISHAALPGIALAFLLTGSKAPLVLLIGAAVAGWLGTWFILEIVRNTRIKTDSAQGIVLSVFFGIGLVLLTFIQKMPTSTQAGLDKFLFGQAATLMTEDVITMTVLGVLALSVVVLFWKEFKLLSFDPDFSTVQGFPSRMLETILTFLIVVSIVIGLQTVGVVLMSAMVVVPAAAARQWTNRLGVMVTLSAFFGALAGISGALISSSFSRLPTGPTIVVSLSVIMLLSLLLAPGRGIVAQALERSRHRNRFAVEGILVDLYDMAAHHENFQHSHTEAALQAIRGKEGVKQGLQALEDRGFAARDVKGHWLLTLQGFQYAEKLIEKGRKP